MGPVSDTYSSSVAEDIFLIVVPLSSEVCASYAEMVNRGDATNTDEWRDLPLNEQM